MVLGLLILHWNGTRAEEQNFRQCFCFGVRQKPLDSFTIKVKRPNNFGTIGADRSMQIVTLFYFQTKSGGN